jgi:tetratricopeptide (TPR) repeat protein
LAERYFDRALEIDPDYALAHKGMAFVWAGRQQFGFAPPAEAGPEMRAAAQRALEADSTIAEVQFILGTTRTWADWDWVGGEQAFRRALELNPSYAEAHAYYSHLLAFLARPDEAMEQAELAVDMDPLNPLIRAMSCVTLRLVGRYDAAIARCEEALRADPMYPLALRGLASALRDSGRQDEYLEHNIAFLRSRGDEERAQVLEEGYDEGGFERAMALAAELLVARSGVEFVQPQDVAHAFADAGEAERALDWLERALRVRDPQMPYLAVVRWPEEIQNHPRFRELLRQMGLPERD